MMDYLHFVCFSYFFIFSHGYYRKSSFSTRDISQCKTIYMCPTFCWTLEKGCFICKCDKSTTEYMTKAMVKMKDDYKPMKQTGSQYILDKLPVGRSKGPWSAVSNEKSMFPGMGSLAGVYSFGGQTSSTDGTGGVHNMKVVNNINKPQYSTSFHPFQTLPGQCPLMDYTCPSSCWFTDSMTGCITCACRDQQRVSTTPKQAIPTVTPGLTSQSIFVNTRQSYTPPTTRKVNQSNKLLTTIHGSTTSRPETTIPLSTHGGSHVRGVCLPIETECPLHCLNYDHQTFCALCVCPSTIPITELNTIPSPTHGDTTTLPTPTHEEPTTYPTTTPPTTEITTKGIVYTCKPLSTLCPKECRTYDSSTYCPICRCEVTTVPSTDGCVALSSDCPAKCVVLGDNGCPQCYCLNITESSDSDINTTDVQLQCPPIQIGCQKECITYDSKNFCPLCFC